MKGSKYSFKLLLEDRDISVLAYNLETVLAEKLETVKNSQVMQEQWHSYQKNFEYAKDVDFKDACDMVVQVMDEMNGEGV